jgi:AmmeMemoRadiSam system protein B
MGSGSWSTPLGKVPIDEKAAGALKKACSFLEEDENVQDSEHSIEVQLPFLQHRFKDFSFVPVTVLNMGYNKGFLKQCEKLGKAIAGQKAGMIASSDFSHYVSSEEAQEKEKGILEAIEAIDPEGMFRELEKVKASVCGFGPIAVLLYAARELGLSAKVIHSSDSGDITGDKSEIVSYHAIGFYRE